mmetsp:Transcript_135457/g.432280  ORF Transcript_135457/g.432280 Transcript_135457/m.432280 type:complete len:213 (-) Transcript_135457:626-1264(-)
MRDTLLVGQLLLQFRSCLFGCLLGVRKVCLQVFDVFLLLTDFALQAPLCVGNLLLLLRKLCPESLDSLACRMMRGGQVCTQSADNIFLRRQLSLESLLLVGSTCLLSRKLLMKLRLLFLGSLLLRRHFGSQLLLCIVCTVLLLGQARLQLRNLFVCRGVECLVRGLEVVFGFGRYVLLGRQLRLEFIFCRRRGFALLGEIVFKPLCALFLFA